ncbi:MAG: hypothetical protein K2N72_02555 [Oscillospiraceae bacterium]|nr:hypothetical protein [Oscillospiraceae bacterium]
MSKFIKRLKDIFTPQRQIFLAVSVIFGLICCNVRLFWDDETFYANVRGQSISYCLKAAADYMSVSSRIFINSTLYTVLSRGTAALGAYMGLCMFVMQSALAALFAPKGGRTGSLFISFICMLFPVSLLYDTGWAATSVTYFCTVSWGMASLVPVRKIYDGRKIGVLEYIFYTLALVMGSNLEQMMVVLLACFLCASVMLTAFKKMRPVFVYIETLLTAASGIFIFTWPGNAYRLEAETAHWFPTFGMLSVLDKADMGISTTLRWLLFESNLFIIVILGFMAYFIFQRYDSLLFRTVSVIPPAVTLLMGPFLEETKKIFPYIEHLQSEIPGEGLISAGSENGASRLVIMLMVMVCIGGEIILLCDDIFQTAACLTLAVTGAASRAALGFSPTIYASGVRTFTVLTVCIMGIGIMLFESNRMKLREREKFENVSRVISLCGIIFGFVNLFFTVKMR